MTGFTALAVGCLASAKLLAASPSTAPRDDEPGVVVEEVKAGSTLARAGIRAGDVLVSWRRQAQPPTHGEDARGELASPFDWQRLLLEQAPRGTVDLDARRAGEVLSFTVEPGEWSAEVRPVMPPSVLERYVQAKEQIDAGNLTAGAEALTELAASVDEESWRLRSWILLRTGTSWSEEQVCDKAQAAYRSALATARDPLAEATVWQAIGDAHWRTQRDFEEAREAYSKAHEIRETTWGDSLALARSAHDLGNVTFVQGEPELARAFFARALALRERLAPGSLETASTLNNLGSLSLELGELAEAASLFQRALEIRQRLAPGSLDVAKSLIALGNVTWFRSELDKATRYFERALAQARVLEPRSFAVAACLTSLGAVASDRGDLERADAYHRRALGLLQELEPGSLNVAASLNNLANVAFERGEHDRAVEYDQRALEIKQEVAPNSLDVAISLYNMSTVAYSKGDLDQASRYLEKAMDMRRGQAPDTQVVAPSLKALGNIAFTRGELDEATAYYEKALAIWREQAPDSLGMASNLGDLGAVAVASGELDEATERYEQSLRILRQLAPDSAAEAEALHALGTVLRKKNQPSKALDLFLQALDALEKQIGRLGGSRDVQAAFRAQRGEYYRDTLELLLELGRPDEAFYTLERSRAQSFLAQLAERDLVFADLPAELDEARRRLAAQIDHVQEQLAHLSSRENASEVEELRCALRRLRDEREDLVEKIRQESPKLAALQAHQPLDLQTARQALDPGTVMLSYSVGEKSTHLFVLTHDGQLQVQELPIGEERLSYFVERADNTTHGQGWIFKTASRIEVNKRLYELLIQPAEPSIEPSSRILIIPDGPLHLLSFAALIREGELPGDEEPELGSRTWRYLVEWKPLHAVLSATVYAELKASRDAWPPMIDDGSALQLAAFGDPLYPGGRDSEQQADVGAVERGFDFAPLPFTRREVEGIAELYPPGAVRLYLGAEASEERVKTLGRRTRILHFAAHGQVDDRLPLNSFVALSRPSIPSAPRDNGLLQAWEIFERVRIDADLVVLSACESGRGRELRGEGLYGLTRAFQYAGARSVLATLWNVVDATTAELMIRFYRHLRQGKTKDAALRAAQLELIDGKIEVFDEEGRRVEKDASAPYYWAAFQLIGDWG